ncbi:MAG: flagellar biosynthetic protein FliO [Acetobacter sp.]
MAGPATAAVTTVQPVAAGLGVGSFVAPVITCIVAFAVVIGLIFLSRYGLKFMEPYLLKGRQTPDLAVMESVAVDQRRRVSVIRYGQKKGLILTGGGNDVFMGWVDEGASCAPTQQPATQPPATVAPLSCLPKRSPQP